ncbi:MAG TPA: FAD-dependent oxidoreductase [Gemmatimonadaceae bacterium]
MTGARVIVVGGGPAGASTAWHLARAGVDVLVLDRARFPRDKPCAEYLSPEASRILAKMDALAACEGAGAAPLAGMIVRAPSGERIHGDFAASHGWRGFRDRGLALRRRVLDAILLDRARAAGARVEEDARVTDLARGADGAVRGVRVIDGDGHATEHRAEIVVGADGLRSVVARRLALARTARAPNRVAFVAHYRGVDGIGEYGEMHVERDGYVGLAPVDDGLTNVAMVVPRRSARGAAGDAAAFLERWLAARAHLVPRFARAERVSRVRAVGPFAHRARRGWAPGAVLVGDAADFFDPFTGEGIYAALRGGELVAPAIVNALGAARRRDANAALAAYDRERRDAFGGKWRVERLVSLAVGWPALMNLAARALSRHKEMADLFVGVTGDFVPPRAVLSARYLGRMLAAALVLPRPTQ